MTLRTGERSPFALTEQDRKRLRARLDLALQRARRSGRPTLATITRALPSDVDPAAVVCSSRREGEPWFVFEQPDRGGAALAGLGEVMCLEDSGPERFATVADRWRSLSARAVADSPGELGGGGGPVAVGGFAFAPYGGGSPAWSGFQPASLLVPEVTLAREDHEGERHVGLTLAALAQPDDTSEELLARLDSRIEELSGSSLPLLDPAPTGRFQVSSGMPPEHYEAAVGRA
ncbi:MAG: isochorismate synthase, partial [Solirubrobacteraceae bacterium]